MKRKILLAIALYLAVNLLPIGNHASCQIGINNTGNPPKPSAMLDVDATNKGLLIPRLTTAERDAISSPDVGLLIFNTDCRNFNAYTGSGWQPLNSTGGSVPDDAGGITGTDLVCGNQSGVSYSIDPISNATGYVWSYTGTGFTIVSGENTNSITVDYSGSVTSGKLTVYGTNACGSGTVSGPYYITTGVFPSSITAYADPGPYCAGSTLSLTGGGDNVESWYWTGPNGYSSYEQSPSLNDITTDAAGVYSLTASNSCGSAEAVNTASVAVNSSPAATASSNSPINVGETLTLTGGPDGADSYAWSGPDDFSSTDQSPTVSTNATTDMSGPYTITVTDNASGCASTASTGVSVGFNCGDDLTITHTAGNVAPETKTITYHTVSIGGQCWLAQNLGASSPPTSAQDNSEEAGGWFWQFNRKQGHSYSTGSVVPSIDLSGISENTDWTSSEDPCTLLLGDWHLPSSGEWGGAGVCGGNCYDAFNSALHMHNDGWFDSGGNYSGRGTNDANNWTATQTGSNTGYNQFFRCSGGCYIRGDSNKTMTLPVRCVK